MEYFQLWRIYKEEKKSAIGIERMTIALQIRCSKFRTKWVHLRNKKETVEIQKISDLNSEFKYSFHIQKISDLNSEFGILYVK